MGDRYTIQIKCADCGEENEHYHAESCCNMSFKCSKCKKINWVSMGWSSTIVSPEREKELYKLNGCE
jgi:DNA-directed RNA polymerase subunit RPC12/RpoP